MCRVAVVIFAVFCFPNIVSCEKSHSRLVDTAQGPGPLPPPVWSDVFEAVDRVIMCPQGNLINLFPDKKTMQEDCLTASVYVPDSEERNLPVVVYVHGGAYVLGWGNLITPKNLVKSKKVIAVTFNYRLGAHGFLCLGTRDAPGNAGMKDQVALLRWVKNNIAKFGGDPEDVTIAGYSAGASSVDLLMISKLTDNLFKRVISESGASTAEFSIQVDPIKSAKEYATLISSESFEDLNALENFYKAVSYEQLNSGNVMNRTDSTFYMSPCVERDIGQETFLDDSPVNILKSGNYKKVPMLFGFANMEGLFRMPLFDYWKELMNVKFSDFLPADLKFLSEDEKEQVAERVKQFYFGDKAINEEKVLAFIDYFTDVIFAYPTLRSIKLQLEAGNDQIYLYEYSYYDDNTPLVPYTNNIRGANHCAQTNIVLDGFYSYYNTSDELKRHKTVMRKIWLNFMTTGKPVLPEDSDLPAWRPVAAEWSPHMSLGRTIQLKRSLLKERSLFWDDIYEKYYFNPLPPLCTLEHTEL